MARGLRAWLECGFVSISPVQLSLTPLFNLAGTFPNGRLYSVLDKVHTARRDSQSHQSLPQSPAASSPACPSHSIQTELSPGPFPHAMSSAQKVSPPLLGEAFSRDVAQRPSTPPEVRVSPEMISTAGGKGNPPRFFFSFYFFQKEPPNPHHGLSENVVCELKTGCRKGQIRLWS